MAAARLGCWQAPGGTQSARAISTARMVAVVGSECQGQWLEALATLGIEVQPTSLASLSSSLGSGASALQTAMRAIAVWSSWSHLGGLPLGR